MVKKLRVEHAISASFGFHLSWSLWLMSLL